MAGDDDPGDGGCEQARQQRRQHERQRQAAEQHLEREQRAAEGDVVDGGHPRAGAGGHQEPSLGGRDRTAALTQFACERSAGELGRGFATERGAQADRDDRERAAHETRR